MVVGIALALAFVFGAADQYLGSLSAHPWAVEASLLSAPWLVLPFVAGWTQPSSRRGAVLGLACTGAALVGYALMTLSPVENAHLTVQTAFGFVRSQRLIFGGMVSGPLFGWWGSRWRTNRSLVGAAIAAGAVCLEPFAHVLAPAYLAGLSLGQPIAVHTVAVAEVAVGLAMAAYFAVAARA
jgi:Family of unknown function (DUF6518)